VAGGGITPQGQVAQVTRRCSRTVTSPSQPQPGKCTSIGGPVLLRANCMDTGKLLNLWRCLLQLEMLRQRTSFTAGRPVDCGAYRRISTSLHNESSICSTLRGRWTTFARLQATAWRRCAGAFTAVTAYESTHSGE